MDTLIRFQSALLIAKTNLYTNIKFLASQILRFAVPPPPPLEVNISAAAIVELELGYLTKWDCGHHEIYQNVCPTTSPGFVRHFQKVTVI